MRIPAILLAAMTAVALPATAATVTIDAVVASVTGARLDAGMAAALPAGAPARVEVTLDPTAPASDVVVEIGDQVVLAFGGDVANALLQPGSTSTVDLDAAAGRITLAGSAAGFIGPAPAGTILTAGRSSLVLSGAPAAPFATGADVLAFLAAPGVTAEGFVDGLYLADDPAEVDFAQRVSLAPIPLPAGGWLLATGAAGLLVMRRRGVRASSRSSRR